MEFLEDVSEPETVMIEEPPAPTSAPAPQVEHTLSEWKWKGAHTAEMRTPPVRDFAEGAIVH
jgi:hypothetical protein